MKKIIKPATKEESHYISDFDEIDFGKFHPSIELKISCNYNSKYDGTELVLHLTDDEIQPILEVIKNKLSNGFKNELENQLKKAEEIQDFNINARDWTACDYNANTISFLSDLLNKKV